MAELSVLEFTSMGSPARVVVDGGPQDLAGSARDLVCMLERRWSRFLDTSEISALNRAPGCVTVVSDATYTLIDYAVRAQDATRGLFNPLMLQQLEAHGYARSWDDGPPTPSDRSVTAGSRDPIVLYPEISAVRLPEDSRFDPGGIGKGLAVDLAIELCMSSGADSASVEIGGDLRVYGTPWYGPEWRIGVTSPFDPSVDIATFTPTSGAVTTSSTLKRCWTHGDRNYHHLLDPITGCPSVTDVVAVTTCSNMAWWSEVAAKSAIIAGSSNAISLLESLGTPGAVVTSDGNVSTTDGNVSTTDGNVSTTDGNVSTTDGNVSTTDGNVSTTDGNVSTTDGKARQSVAP